MSHPERWLPAWERRLRGEPADPSDAEELRGAREADPDWVERLADDAALDGWLLGAARGERDGESFVWEVMQRWESEGGVASNAASNARSNATSNGASAPAVDDERVEAPPVAAPPIAPARLATLESAPVANSDFSHLTQQGWRLAIPATWAWTAALSLTLAALLVGYAMQRGWLRAKPTDHGGVAGSNRREPPVLSAQPAVWKLGGPLDERLPIGRHELTRGTATLRGDAGWSMDLVAPAIVEVRGTPLDELVELRRGQLRLVGRAEQGLVRVATPGSALRQFDGAIELAVDDVGDTEVVVERGVALLDDRSDGAGEVEPVRLDELEFNRARLFAPRARRAATLAARQLEGPGHKFVGRIGVNGHVLEFSSAETFAALHRRMQEQIAAAPDQLVEAWTSLADSFDDASESKIQLWINGKRVESRSGDALFGGAAGGFSLSESTGSQGESFHATLTINGETRTFKSRAEFEAARRELLAPWRGLLPESK